MLPCRLAPPGTIEVSRKFGLPALPSSEIVLLSTLSDARSRQALRTLATAFRENRPSADLDSPTKSAGARIRASRLFNGSSRA